MATSTDHRIKVPDGLTLGDLIDAIDLRSNTITAGRNDHSPLGFALGVLSTGLTSAMHGDATLLRTDYATATVIAASDRDYAHLATMAAERADAVEHARRLAAEATIDDDGPVAA